MKYIDYSVLPIRLDYFKNMSLEDPFFDSLKKDYPEFSKWFLKKQDAQAFVYKDMNGCIQGFLYLKIEGEEEDYGDFSFLMPQSKKMKIGTFKISKNGYSMGERFFKIIFDHSILNNIKVIYVTIFDKHEFLCQYFEAFGFLEKGIKKTTNEKIYMRNLEEYIDNRYHGYPILDLRNNNFFMLPIYPKYHTLLLPDAILNNENALSYQQNHKASNTLSKVYIGKNLWSGEPNPGDVVFFYRTKDMDNLAPAHYQSVITSIGVISGYGRLSSLEDVQRKKIIEKSALEADEKARILQNCKNFWYIIFVYYGKLNHRKVHLKYMREHGMEAPRGLIRLPQDFGNDILQKSGYDGGIIIK